MSAGEIGGAPLSSRLFDAAPSFVVAGGLIIWVSIRQHAPHSLTEAVGAWSWAWLLAIIIACGVNTVLTVMPKRGSNGYLAEIAARILTATLLCGFAVASWAEVPGHGIRGILAFSVGLWHLSRWRRLREEAEKHAAVEQIRRRNN